MCYGLVPRVVLLGGGGGFRRWGLVRGPRVTGVIPLEDTVGPQSLSLCPRSRGEQFSPIHVLTIMFLPEAQTNGTVQSWTRISMS